jgi:transposase InsO family protein
VLCSTDENPLRITNIEKYKIIDELRNEYPIERVCNVLNINSRSYRKWISKGKPIMNNYNKKIAEIITVEHNDNYKVYGTLRLKEFIKRKYNIEINHKCIRRYKRALGLKTIVRDPNNKITNVSNKEKNLAYMAKNVLNCNFISEAPYEKLSTDVSYIPCTDGLIYLSAVKDLFNKKIISYVCSERNNTELVLDTLNKVPKGRGIIHSDQGSLYYSWDYRKRLEELGYTRSMSEKGKCWQNAPIENWFSQLKEEWLRRIGKQSKKETIKSIKKYVHWYNNERIQKCLGYLSPNEFKTAI